MLALLILPMLLAACGGGQQAPGPAALKADNAGLMTPESSTCRTPPTFTADSFADPTRVDNPYLPFPPGQQFILEGTAVDHGRALPHRIETTATNLTKVIDGVRTLVVFEQDFESGVLQESEIFFQAQDRNGAVWNFGEYPEEYDNGILRGAPSTWLVGVDGGVAGYAMLGRPQTGTQTYVQGIGPEVGFHDCATVIQSGRRICSNGTCYDKVIVIDEYAPTEPGNGHQHKLLAPGVSTFNVANGSGNDIEALDLTSAKRLCGAALQKIVDETAVQDHRAYGVAPKVWQGTAPVEATLPLPAC
jgi:hypothetical protein